MRKRTYHDKKKRKLTGEQEFQIFKLVLDKFLWLGFVIMIYGLYELGFVADGLGRGVTALVVGAVVLLIMVWLVTKEYEFIK